MRDLAEVTCDDAGVPTAVTWRSKTYEVEIGSAVRLEDLASGLTHPPRSVTGWRVDVVSAGVPAWRYRLALKPAAGGWAIVTVASAVASAA
jgi:hypothetical protein